MNAIVDTAFAFQLQLTQSQNYQMLPLTEIETRVLGSLIEKDITTPDYYPLSLNALVNACNQKNNRDPVMTLDEDSVRQALATLQENVSPDPPAAPTAASPNTNTACRKSSISIAAKSPSLCVLLLRGPQTPGELRSRTERMYHFEALDDIVSTLDRLSQRQPPLAAVLPRQPGTKESRYMQLFSGDAPPADVARAPSPASDHARTSADDRISHLENEVLELKREVAEIHAATRHLPQTIRITPGSLSALRGRSQRSPR